MMMFQWLLHRYHKNHKKACYPSPVVALPFLFLVTGLTSSCSKNPLDAVFKRPISAPQPSCGFLQNAYGERISWKTNLPVRMYIHESVPRQFVPVIYSSMKHWEGLSKQPLFQIVSESYRDSGQARQDGFNVIYWVTSDWPNTNGKGSHSSHHPKMEQARTTVHTVGNQIVEADLRINAQRFDFYVDQPKSPLSIHFESLMIHELGHVLGLAHNEHSPNDIMWTHLLPLTERTQFSEENRMAIQCEYN
ncbi:MAG: matrixin family metalloprotease [Bdellovibrionaceae bacterium]|nr:matrixin family metalloprotease [Pseudobdellovibrionaceae bacterium]MDW8190912.1 matrixin family metalloprotease [Pseudobdellovibrionaceae bacterium]